MKDWSKPYEIVYKKFCKQAQEAGEKASQLAFARFLGASQGKVKAWAGGQWPLASDLAVLAEKLGFSYQWLVTGEGEPEECGRAAAGTPDSARNAAGRLVGHLLHDIIKGELRLTPDQFATATGIGRAALDELLESRRLPSWDELTRMSRAFGVSPLFLLTGQGRDTRAADGISRFSRATGVPGDAYNVSAALGVPVEEVEAEIARQEAHRARYVQWLTEHPGDVENAPLPPLLPEFWRMTAHARYGINPAWLDGIEGVPSHVVRSDPMLARLDGLIARMKTYGGTDEQVQDLILSFARQEGGNEYPEKGSMPAVTVPLSEQKA